MFLNSGNKYVGTGLSDTDTVPSSYNCSTVSQVVRDINTNKHLFFFNGFEEFGVENCDFWIGFQWLLEGEFENVGFQYFLRFLIAVFLPKMTIWITLNKMGTNIFPLRSFLLLIRFPKMYNTYGLSLKTTEGQGHFDFR